MEKATIKETIEPLLTRGWLEIEALQTQLSALDSEAVPELYGLTQNLLTSYYIYVGGLETLKDQPSTIKNNIQKSDTSVNSPVVSETAQQLEVEAETTSTPFEYFVDFDEPIGPPLTDDDIYRV